MAKIPVYQQQTTMQPVQASGQAGAVMGQALSQVGDTLQTIGSNIQARSDVINRVRALDQFDTESISNLETFRTSGDIASEETLTQFSNDLDNRVQQSLNNFKGSPMAREQLRAQLENQASQYRKSALTDQIQAQHRLMADSIQKTSNTLATQAALAPEQLDNALAEFDSTIEQYAPALTPDQERDYRASGKASILTNAISSLMEKGQYETADKLVKSSEYQQYLNPSVTRKFAIESAVGMAQNQARIDQENARVAEFSMLTRRQLSSEEIQRIKMLPEKKSQYTPADMISEYEIVTGKPATQAVIDDIYNIADDADSLGTTGAMRRLVNDKAIAYQNGLLTPQEAMEYQIAVNELYSKKTVTDPITGDLKEIQPSLPALIQQSLDRGAAIYGTPDLNRNGMDQESTSVRDEFDLPEGESMWEMAGYITGPTAGAARFLERTPFTEGLGIDPTYKKAAQRANRMKEQIVAGIKPEGKIADQYRQELMALVEIEPELWDNETALRNRMVEIDGQLRTRLKELRSIADGEKPASVQERRDALRLSNNIVSALSGLGINRVATPQEAAQLPLNSWFVDPSGRVGKIDENTKRRLQELGGSSAGQ